jgi:long-chain acyl-CoA synthetase
VDECARGLAALDLPHSGGHPARVAIALPNRPEYVAVLFGALRAGLVALPVNPGYTARELRQILEDSGAQVLVASAGVLDALGDDPAAPPHRYRVGEPVGPASAAATDLAALRAPGDPVEPGTGGDDLAVLIYTSGTEGRPKGAMLSHRALLANHDQLARVEPAPIGPDDVVLLAVPLFHAYGLNSGLGSVAYHGATGVLVEAFDPADSLRLVAAHQVSAVIGVPAMFLAWSLLPDFGEAMASVRVAVCGAAPLEAATSRRFLDATRHPIFVGYGLTETAPVLTTSLASPVPKEGSIGRAIPGVEIALVSAGGEEVWRSSAPAAPADDFDDDASGSPGTDPGEIVARGANLFSGYWPDGHDGPDADGWWATGDVAYADADGDLFLVDRLRELILVNGFNVYPLEVEQVLGAHPAVGEAAVLGVPHPYTGQAVKAYVVAATPVGTEELLAHCERNLARYKCPTSVEFVDALPHSATGKVRKAALRTEPAGVSADA